MRNNTEPEKRKKEARRGVALFAVFQIVCAAVFGSLCFIPDLPGWTVVLFAIIALSIVLSVFPALGALKERYKEIEGGELDEARQY